jgi:hypothetical protein
MSGFATAKSTGAQRAGSSLHGRDNAGGLGSVTFKENEMNEKQPHPNTADLERALIDAICEQRGVERCTLPHCDCATLAANVARKVIAGPAS